MMRYTFGDKAKDKITGFEGIVTGFTRFITGCDQYCLTPQGVDKEGKTVESKWFDENRIEITAKQVVVIESVQASEPMRTGGPGYGSERPALY